MKIKRKRRSRREAGLQVFKKIKRPKNEGDGIQTADYVPRDYRDGANGFIWWVEENVIVSLEIDKVHQSFYMGDLPTHVNPETGRAYNNLWEKQKEVLREALQMENGVFKHNIIVFCWMRGDGKSFLACLIQLWKFFCFERQIIKLGANNKDQSQFVHFGIMKGIVLNSPKLLAQVGGAKNVQEKEIRIISEKGERVSSIASMSTSTGIVSNITGYTFSEIFAMNNPKFFNELHGSIRNITNALGIVDSTVSAKSHLLYSRLYKGYVDGVLKKCYFSHRQSREGNSRDFWHPNMTQTELNDFKHTLDFGAFDQFFKNTWESGMHSMFPLHLIYGTRYIGYEKQIGNSKKLLDSLHKITDYEAEIEDIDNHREVKDATFDTRIAITSKLTSEFQEKILDLKCKAMPLSQIHTLNGETPPIPDISVIEEFTKIYQTDWALGVGLDMGDSLAVEAKANTMMSLTLKGLPGSLNNPDLLMEKAGTDIRFIYILLHLCKIPSHDTDDIKKIMDEYHEVFDGIDSLSLERYRAASFQTWSKERDILFVPVHPSYGKQRAMFQLLYNSMETGMYKAPATQIPGAKESDIMEEEFKMFDHDYHAKWFGSPMKNQKKGIQDDSVYACGWSIAGLQEIAPFQFRKRKTQDFNFLYLPPQ